MWEEDVEEVFRIVCRDCGYVFYAPNDDIDYCPHCRSENIDKEIPLENEEPYFVVKKVIP